MRKPLSYVPFAIATLILSLVAIADATAQDPPADPSPTTSYQIKQKGHFGVGLNLGTHVMPISLKYFATDNFSFQFAGPFWGIFWGGYGLGTSTDFLYEPATFANLGSTSLSWQIGAGPDFFWYMYRYAPSQEVFNSYAIFGFHANIGFQILLDSLSMDVVLEYRPGFYISKWNPIDATTKQNPNQPLNLFASPYDFSLAVRYYF